MIKAIDVANVFLKLSEPESGDSLTNLKLQKLIYYVQGFHLAIYGDVLFDEPILHWEHGPVVRELYDILKEYGSNSVPIPQDFDASILSKEQLKLIEEVNSVYGQFSAWKLRDMTHAESPWLNTTKDEVITPDSMKPYFKTLLV